MARLNLTIPDALYERLERLRDRVNVSKICATALTKELEMLEGVNTGGDTKVQRLVDRFLKQKERWYRRGRQDGELWAMERASLEELRQMEEDWEDEEDEEENPDFESLDDDFPTLNMRPSLKQWAAADRSEGITEEPDGRSYFQGWYHGARDLWKQAKPSLRGQH